MATFSEAKRNELESWEILPHLKDISLNAIRFVYVYYDFYEKQQKALIQEHQGDVYEFSCYKKQLRKLPILCDKSLSSACAGYNFIIILTKEGEVYSYGRNNYGQLGDGSKDHRDSPVRVGSSVFDEKITRIQAGSGHGLALDKLGRVYGWGSNSNSELGKLDKEYPNPLVVIRAMDIYAGNTSSAVITAEGEIKVMGTMGSGDGKVQYSLPTSIKLPGPVSEICAGGTGKNTFMLFLLQDTSVFCLGSIKPLEIHFKEVKRVPLMKAKSIWSGILSETCSFVSMDDNICVWGRDVRINSNEARKKTAIAEIDCSSCPNPCQSINEVLGRHGDAKDSMKQPVIVGQLRNVYEEIDDLKDENMRLRETMELMKEKLKRLECRVAQSAKLKDLEDSY